MISTYRLRAALALFVLACTFAFAPPAPAAAADNPTITSISPSSGPASGGTPVTISGSGFLPGALVYIGSTPATSVVVVSWTQITAVTPQGAQGSANLVIVNTDGGVGNATAVYFYTANSATLSIGGVTPPTGATAGDTLITITGTGFAPGATVLMGGIPAPLVTWLGSSQLWARTPPNSAGSVTVSVLNPNGGSATLASAFTYGGASGVTVTSVSPSGGLATGGANVTVTGTGFASGATVRFGATNATNVVFVNSTQLIATTPAAPTGTVPVTVTNSNGTTQTLGNGFTFGAAGAGGPTITSASPATGPSAGGTTITLTGTGFTGGSTVLFGNAASPTITYLGSSQLFVVTPANNPGAATITVINSSGGAGTLPGGFTYEGASGLTVASVTPSAGPPAGGATVTIAGSGFQTGAVALFGNVPAASTTVVGSTQIIARTPAAPAGTVNVTVTNSGGLSAVLPNGYTFGAGLGGPQGPLIVTSISPNSGPPAGGGTVTIGGSGFATGASVTFGSLPATSVTVVSNSQITAIAPASSVTAGAIVVTVVNPGGISGSLAAAFTYQAGPAAGPGPGPTPGPINLPARGFGLFVFAGGTSEQLVTATTGCPQSSAAYYATNPAGEFVVYVPGTSIGAVNAAWRALFPASIPANTPLIGRCS